MVMGVGEHCFAGCFVDILKEYSFFFPLDSYYIFQKNLGFFPPQADGA